MKQFSEPVQPVARIYIEIPAYEQTCKSFGFENIRD